MINQKYCDIMGLRHDQMTAATFMSITHPDDLQADLENMERLKAGEIAHSRWRKDTFARTARLHG
jgi:diguanylate cyclase